MENINAVAIGFLVYNVIAFGTQPIIGYFCDEHTKIPIGIIGCCFVLIGLLTMLLPFISLFLCAFGNACFHIGGGIDSLKLANGGIARSGIFVSTGAVGVVLGTALGQYANATVFIPFVLLMISLFLLFKYTLNQDYSASSVFKTSSSLHFSMIIAFSCFAIAIRAYAGGLIPTHWKSTQLLMLLPGFGACAGKAVGGYLGDRFGAKNIGVFSLLLSIPFICFGNGIVIFSIVGIVLFNMTMPITLCVIASKFPNNPGLAFGISTLALLFGSIPGFVFRISQNYAVFLLIALVILSALFIFISTQNERRK